MENQKAKMFIYDFQTFAEFNENHKFDNTCL